MNTKQMTNRHSLRLAAILVGSWLLCFTVPSALAEPPVSQSNESSTSQVSATEDESLEARYARAHYELAKLDLRRAEYWNRQIPNLISQRTMDYLKKHVEVDAEQLRQCQQRDYADVHQIYVRGAKAALDLAEADVARKQLAHERGADVYSALELDRSIAVLNVAKLNLERTVSQQDSLQTISFLQWQLEELRNQVLELQVKMESNSRR